MIEPPENHDKQPHEVAKHYYMMYAEIIGYNLDHDDYCCIANWMLSYIAINNQDFQDQF